MPGWRSRAAQDVLAPHQTGGRPGRPSRAVDRHPFRAAPELEGQEKRGEADHGPERPDGYRSGPDAPLPKLGPLAGRGRSGRHHHLGEPEGEQQSQGVGPYGHHGGSRLPDQQGETTDPSAHHAAHGAQEGQLGVGFHQL